MRKSHFLLYLLSLLSLAGCRNVLSEDRMADLLTDMYLYDEELAGEMKGTDSVSVYRSVFVKHGCSEEEYREAIARYAEQPKVMKGIYEAVKVRLEGYKAQFDHALQLESYMLTAPPHDTLLYVTFDDDSTKQVYLPKFRIQPADTLLITIPERPGKLERPDTAQRDKADRLERLARRPVRSTKPAAHLQPLP
jgi:hypothetical protein